MMALDKIRSLLTHLLWVILVVVVSKALAEGTWMILAPDSNQVMPVLQSGKTADSAASADSLGFARWKLFGVPAKTAPQPSVSVQNAPKTRLNLVLKGVITAAQPENSGAIVSERGKPESYYRVGDKMPGNAELVEVYDDRVLLKRNGRLETLTFEKVKGRGGVSVAAARPNSGGIETAEQFVNVAQQRLKQNPVAALSSVGLTAVKRDQSAGYVYNGSNPMLAGLNLKKGDIIVSVNGHPLGNIKQDQAMFKEMSKQNALDVEIERDGTRFSINYPLR